jgi:peptidoglycan/LPS O-acetylase OafA/YrhL
VTYHVHDLLQSEKIGRLRQWLAALLLLPAIVVLGLLAVYRPPSVIWYYVAAVGYALLLLGFSTWNGNHMVNRFTCYLGRISYSLYLNHPSLVYILIPAYLGIYKMALGPNVAFLTCAALTLAVLVSLSHFTFKFIESPMMKWGKQQGARHALQEVAVTDLKHSKSDA